MAQAKSDAVTPPALITLKIGDYNTPLEFKYDEWIYYSSYQGIGIRILNIDSRWWADFHIDMKDPLDAWGFNDLIDREHNSFATPQAALDAAVQELKPWLNRAYTHVQILKRAFGAEEIPR